MAMTQLALLFIGLMASGTGFMGLFVRLGDRWTRVLLIFISAILWGLFGMSSFDVIVRDASFASASEPIIPLVYVGIGMAFMTALYGMYELIWGTAQEASETEFTLNP